MWKSRTRQCRRFIPENGCVRVKTQRVCNPAVHVQVRRGGRKILLRCKKRTQCLVWRCVRLFFVNCGGASLSYRFHKPFLEIKDSERSCVQRTDWETGSTDSVRGVCRFCAKFCTTFGVEDSPTKIITKPRMITADNAANLRAKLCTMFTLPFYQS